MLIAKEQVVTALREELEGKASNITFENKVAFEQELKRVRREQVDTIHYIGTHRQQLEAYHTSLKAFEELHREEFLKYFNEIKEKVAYPYTQSLDYFGCEFNASLFKESERSSAIQMFKTKAGIQGSINLCKYVEYYLRNVVPEALADVKHKGRLLSAKKYCEDNKGKI
jgi:hypothetical protein